MAPVASRVPAGRAVGESPGDGLSGWLVGIVTPGVGVGGGVGTGVGVGQAD